MKTRKFTRILLGTVLVCAAITFDSRYRIESRVYELYSLRLPENFDNLRVVQISDLHGMSFGDGNSKLIRAVLKAQPDIIALTGDFIDSVGDIGDFETLIEGLKNIAPMYFVSGNHDWSSGAIKPLAQMLERQGVTYLRNEYMELTSGGEKIILCGVEDPNGFADNIKPDALIEKLRREYPEEYVLLLGHRNYWIDKYPFLDVDTILCGHAHGGVIRLPFVGGVMGTNFELFPDYTDGAYRSGGYNLIVSRGLGNSAPASRFLNNPHLPVIVLRRGDASR